MPRWARFLSASVAGSAAGVTALLAVAWWRVGVPPGYWWEALQFAASPAFWALGRASLLLTAAAVLAGRLALHLGLMSPVRGGAAAGAALALLWGLSLVLGRSPSPLAFFLRLGQEAPEVLLLALPFAAAGAVGSLLFEHLAP